MPLDEDVIVEGEFDAGDSKQVNNRKRRSKQRAHDDDEVLKGLLATSKGRSWLWRQLLPCHIFETSFDADPARMSFREGERNIGNRLLASIVRVEPAAFPLMMTENSSNG